MRHQPPAAPRLPAPMPRALISLWLTAAALCAQEPETPEPEPPAEQQPQPEPEPAAEAAEAAPAGAAAPRLRGRVELRYVGRWAEGSHDNDLYGYGEADFGDAREHAVTLHASGRVALDLDRDRDATDPFLGVDDTYSKDLTGRLYTAYVDLNDVADNPLRGTFHRVRAGRQVMYDTPQTLFLDGVSVETKPLLSSCDLTLHGFVGSPSHLFESSANGDIAFGGAALLSPWTAGQLRFDYMHVTDRYLSATAHDDLFGLRFDQRIASSLFLSAHVNSYELEDWRDLGVHAQWSDPDADLTLVARYTALLEEQTRHSIDLDYFTTIESTYFAYDQFEFSAHKGLGDHAYLAGGVDFRELRDDSDEGTFNHEFRRFHASPGVTSWPWEGFEASVTVEYWDATGDTFVTYGGDLEQELSEEWRAAAGLLYQLYRYDALTEQERENVYVSYVKLTWDATADLRLWGTLEYENGNTEDFFTFLFNTRISF